MLHLGLSCSDGAASAVCPAIKDNSFSGIIAVSIMVAYSLLYGSIGAPRFTHLLMIKWGMLAGLAAAPHLLSLKISLNSQTLFGFIGPCDVTASIK